MRASPDVRIGVLDSWFAGPDVVTAPAVVEAGKGVLRHAVAAAVQVVATGAPDPRGLDACDRIIPLAEACANHEVQLRADPSVHGRLARHRFALGAFLSAADLLQARRQRIRLAAAIDALFERFDLLVRPAEISGAPRFDDAVSDESLPFVAGSSLRIPFNPTGHPALALPAGFDENGMSVSLQPAGRRGAEAALFAAAHALGPRLGVRDARPPGLA
jgi:aspartyl-tRNA(Asn)/glutamyl-tRNA(Gln) amidotransferase subunit A